MAVYLFYLFVLF